MDWNPEILASTLSTFKLIRHNDRKWMLCWFTQKIIEICRVYLKRLLPWNLLVYFERPISLSHLTTSSFVQSIVYLALESQTIASAIYYKPQNLLDYFLCLYANAWNRKLFTMNAKEYFNELSYNDRHTSYANVISCKMVMIAKP